MSLSRRVPGRPFDAAIEAELLRVTQTLLIEVGFEGLTVDAVAKRCNASKATIYRRWPSKIALAVAATVALLPAPEMPDTGDLREDLIVCGHGFIHEEGRVAVLSSLLTAARHNSALRIAAREALGAPLSRKFEHVLTRAVSRGVIAKDIDIDIISEVFPAIAFHYVAALGLPIDEHLLLRVIDGVLLPALHVT